MFSPSFGQAGAQFNQIFPAQIGVQLSGFVSGAYSGAVVASGMVSYSGWYTWTEQGYTSSGFIANNLGNPRTGSFISGFYISPAQNIFKRYTPPGTIVWMKTRSLVQGSPTYEFAYQGQLAARMSFGNSIHVSGGSYTPSFSGTVFYDNGGFFLSGNCIVPEEGIYHMGTSCQWDFADGRNVQYLLRVSPNNSGGTTITNSIQSYVMPPTDIKDVLNNVLIASGSWVNFINFQLLEAVQDSYCSSGASVQVRFDTNGNTNPNPQVTTANFWIHKI